MSKREAVNKLVVLLENKTKADYYESETGEPVGSYCLISNSSETTGMFGDELALAAFHYKELSIQVHFDGTLFMYYVDDFDVSREALIEDLLNVEFTVDTIIIA